MAIKSIDNEKTINFNPTFIFYELYSIIGSDSVLILLLNLILFGFIILILYFFFHIEVIYIYKLIFNKIDETDKEKKYKIEYTKKIEDLFTSKIECLNGVATIFKADGTRSEARNLKGDIIRYPFCKD